MLRRLLRPFRYPTIYTSREHYIVTVAAHRVLAVALVCSSTGLLLGLLL